MRNILAIIILLLVCNFASSECLTPIDKSKVVLFINANASYPEIKSASEAACENGQHLISIPSEEKTLPLFEQLQITKTIMQKRVKLGCLKSSIPKAIECDDLKNQ